MSETVKTSEVQEMIRRGEKVADHKAVIRPAKASKLVVPNLGTFEMKDPIRTNDLAYAQRCEANGNLSVAYSEEAKAELKANAAKAEAKTASKSK